MLEQYADVLKIEDICEILHIGKNNAYKMLQSNEIPNKKIRRKYVIPKLGIINYLTHISESV